MVQIYALLIEIVLTFAICFLVILYFRRFLHQILVELCGTEDRARFWLAFSNVLLIGFPITNSLGYRPTESAIQYMAFDLFSRISGNLVVFLITFFGIGVVISIFAFAAPKTNKTVSK